MASKKAFFEPVDLKIDFPEAERKLLNTWEKKGIVKKYLNRNIKSKKYFSFIDGPITANNPMGVHHAWGRTYKDLWQRFKNMQGYRQRFQNGFDCQGLWVEVEVEKELGFKNKKDIEVFGIAKFVDLCRERVKKYSGIQTEQSKRLGYFMDWDNSYFTLSDDNNYMIWHFLKVCNDLGWIYKGADAVAWCPRCETAISQHEMLTEDYKELTHDSVFLAFPVTGQENEYLLVWTTTPWTVPANVAIAIDADLDYSLVEPPPSNGIPKKYWVAKGAKDRVFAGVKAREIKTAKGSKLVGLRYVGAFDSLPKIKEVISQKNDKFHTVVATDDLILPITTDEGTGMVHIATSSGAEDYKLGKKINLPVISVIADDASYLSNLGFLSGQNAKKHPEIILDYLKKLDSLGKHFYIRIERYTHRYPACWRCKTELVWKVTDEWYISMDVPAKIINEKRDVRTLRERMKAIAEKINWLPTFGLDREMDWLTNMHDWLISKKNRYWGLALPIWECQKCRNFEVIGSKEELNERSITGKLKGSPHKPQIDTIKIKCSKCGATSSRIEPVGNPWLDAGIVPFSTIPLYLTDKEKWRKWFPADFITESFPGQFKNWFYSLIAMSTVLEDTNPFRSVLGFGSMLDEKGEAFHKSKGNSIEFNEGADKIGVDVMRWMFAKANPADNLLFGPNIADEVRRRFHLKLWNIYNFFVTYASLDGWKPSRNYKSQMTNHKLSILDKWILIRLKQTVGLVTEALEKYDAATASAEIEKFVDDLSLWYVRRSRDRVGPAAESESDRVAFYNTLYSVLCTLSKLLAPFTPFMADLIYTNLTKEDSVHLVDWPKASEKRLAISDKLIEEMQRSREIVEKAHSIRKEIGFSVKQPLKSFLSVEKPILKNLEYLIKAEINVKNIVWNSKTDKFDTKITPKLKEEAEVRDLVRQIQDARKNMGLNLTQFVNVWVDKIPVSTELTQWMKKKAQIEKLEKGSFKVVKSS